MNRWWQACTIRALYENVRGLRNSWHSLAFSFMIFIIVRCFCLLLAHLLCVSFPPSGAPLLQALITLTYITIFFIPRRSQALLDHQTLIKTEIKLFVKKEECRPGTWLTVRINENRGLELAAMKLWMKIHKYFWSIYFHLIQPIILMKCQQ